MISISFPENIGAYRLRAGQIKTMHMYTGDKYAFIEAVDYFGSIRALADAIGLNPSTVQAWKKSGLSQKWEPKLSQLMRSRVKNGLVISLFRWTL